MLPLLALTLAARPAPAPDPAAVAEALRDQALADEEAWSELAWLSDRIGPRPAGSAGLAAAVQATAGWMADDGLRVVLEPVDVPVWQRGPAAAVVTAPRERRLALLALGNSVPTPPGGVHADVLVVSSFDELTARAAEAAGRVVVWDTPFTTYGETVRYRWGGASAASRVGAVASLVRSVTPVSLDTPHTGGQGYAPDVTPIPAAAITVEDAAWLHRLQDAGVTPRVHLELSASQAPDAPSANVVGELRGRELPDEVVVLGCHLDSWDVGQGAQDDAAGCVTVMAAGALLAGLPTPPRRTVRVVMYTNEELGLRGARAYAKAHAGERIVYAVEDDTGAGAPLGFDVEVAGPDGQDGDASPLVSALAAWSPWLAPLGADPLQPGHSGADVGQLVPGGTVGLGLRHDLTGYWPVHHTEADTLDKIDPALVRRNVAAMVVMAWTLAEVAPTPAAFAAPPARRR